MYKSDYLLAIPIKDVYRIYWKGGGGYGLIHWNLNGDTSKFSAQKNENGFERCVKKITQNMLFNEENGF